MSPETELLTKKYLGLAVSKLFRTEDGGEWKWYHGRVSKCEGKLCTVLYDDGDMEVHDEDALKKLLKYRRFRSTEKLLRERLMQEISKNRKLSEEERMLLRGGLGKSEASDSVQQPKLKKVKVY